MKQASLTIGSIRQGDVLLVPVASVPETAFLVPCVEEIVLAEGEVTGHRHVFNRKMDDAKIESFLGGGLHFLRIGDGGAKLRHGSGAGRYRDGDHAPVDVPPGTYQVVRQQEYRYGDSGRVSD